MPAAKYYQMLGKILEYGNDFSPMNLCLYFEKAPQHFLHIALEQNPWNGWNCACEFTIGLLL